jgi:hypothetical protein
MAALGALCGGIARSSSALTHDDRVDAVAGAVAHFQRAMMMDVDQAAKAMRDEEILAEIEDFLEGVNRHAKRTPDRPCKKDPSACWVRLVPVANRRAPRASRSAVTSDGAAARGRCLFAHRGKPGWHSAAVFETPALVAGFDDFAVMGQTVEERRRHLGVAEHRAMPQ